VTLSPPSYYLPPPAPIDKALRKKVLPIPWSFAAPSNLLTVSFTIPDLSDETTDVSGDRGPGRKYSARAMRKSELAPPVNR